MVADTIHQAMADIILVVMVQTIAEDIMLIAELTTHTADTKGIRKLHTKQIRLLPVVGVLFVQVIFCGEAPPPGQCHLVKDS